MTVPVMVEHRDADAEKPMRTPNEAEYTHERLGDRFAEALSTYDTRRRVHVLIDQFLSNADLQGMKVLDVGCGLGFFSQRLKERGAEVTACDIGPNLVRHTEERVGCRAEVADALQLSDHFGQEQFDIVVSSECIEHTPDPDQALNQMARILRPGGLLSVSTPNIVWYPVVRLATMLRVRPFDGFENFSSWRRMRHSLADCGVHVLREQGLHLFPFQLRLHQLSSWCDQHCQPLRGLMINICMLGRKKETGPSGPTSSGKLTP